MKKLLIILFAVTLGLNLNAQDNCEPSPDLNEDGVVGMSDLLTLLSDFGEFDLDFDGVLDSVDDCFGVYDSCGVCNGTGEDNDEDGLCDDVDDCVGAYDECGVCNGPGPTIPVVDEIIYVTDSVFIDSLDEWQVFEYAADTLLTYSCLGPSECGGISTLTYDGHMYDLVAIGNQCWFAENLRNAHYSNGDSIPGELSFIEWDSTSEGAQVVYGEWSSIVIGGDPDEVANLENYGRLFNWYAVDDARGLCPSGWHVPSDGDWTVITDFLGGEEVAGGEMKTTYGWNVGGNGTNSSGFSGLPGGFRDNWTLFFMGQGLSGRFWSSTENGEGYAWGRVLDASATALVLQPNEKSSGLSVRCLKNSEE